ncbi:hypothetical protein LEN26_017763 [Aphanomyces euteiches]|nr:hypothetical protein LEN26_017763 [Aphanomyces euteiches]
MVYPNHRAAGMAWIPPFYPCHSVIGGLAPAFLDCKKSGILQYFSPAYTPELNGMAERMNRTLIESARCMLEHARLPKGYWAEAVVVAAHIRYRMPTQAIEEKESPYEVATGRKPKIGHFRVFGCEAFVHVPKE